MLKKRLLFLRNKWVLQPFLIAIYIILTNISDYGLSYVKWNIILLVLVGIIAYWAIIFSVLKLFFKNNESSCFIATFIVFTTLLFESIHNTFYFIHWLRERYMVLIITLVFFFIIYIIVTLASKSIRFPKRTIGFLNLLFVILNIFSLFRIMTNKMMVEKPNVQFDSQSNIKKNPDIYLIIPDGYARPKNLKKYWGFDDSVFINQLTNMGFYYAQNSKSNYCYTIQTVATMLNLDYLREGDKWNNGIVLNKIEKNKTVDLLQQKGYNIINFSFCEIDDNPGKYVDGDLDFISNFQLFVFSKTIFFDVKKYIVAAFSVTPKRLEKIVEREEKINNDLLSVIPSKDNKPKFVYYHSMITHFPYYIDDSGMVNLNMFSKNSEQEKLPTWITSKEGINTFGTPKRDSLWMKNYLNAIKYSNTMVLQLVKKIMNNHQNPSIIVVMSDHGFRLVAGRHFQDAEPERYSNFCAIYFPNKHYESLYDSITPINAMRAVLNNAIATHLKLLPDRSELSNE